MCRILQIPLNMNERVYLPNVTDVMQNETFHLHNAGLRCQMLKIWQIPRKLYCLFLSFFGFDGFASFLSWLWKVLRTSWLDGFVCVHLFTATKATIVRKPQTPPRPKQRPQHQHLLVCSSSYTTNNNHNSNNNNDNNNNKNNDNKVPLQLQL
jgi:hypothetical protein